MALLPVSLLETEFESALLASTTLLENRSIITCGQQVKAGCSC